MSLIEPVIDWVVIGSSARVVRPSAPAPAPASPPLIHHAGRTAGSKVELVIVMRSSERLVPRFCVLHSPVMWWHHLTAGMESTARTRFALVTTAVW